MKFNRYTDTEVKKLLKNIIILTDTREQKNRHILDYLDNKKILHKEMKLDHGDYTVMLPKNEKLGIHRDIYLNNVISIERKANLEELSNNFTKGRTQIENEFIRSKGKLILLIEKGSYKDIILHNYNTEYNPKSFIATLQSFKARYNIEVMFLDDKSFTGNFIYYTFKYHIRDLLRYGTLGKAV